DDGTLGQKLWKSNGTTAGTVPVNNFVSSHLTKVEGTLSFTANDGIHGDELWKLVNDATPLPSLNVSGLPAALTAGAAGSFTVTAKNADGSTNTGYLGRVHF